MNLNTGCQIMQTKAKNTIYYIKYFEFTELLAWTCRRSLKTEVYSQYETALGICTLPPTPAYFIIYVNYDF